MGLEVVQTEKLKTKSILRFAAVRQRFRKNVCMRAYGITKNKTKKQRYNDDMISNEQRITERLNSCQVVTQNNFKILALFFWQTPGKNTRDTRHNGSLSVQAGTVKYEGLKFTSEQ